MKKEKKMSLVELESDKRAVTRSGSRSLTVCVTKYLKQMGVGAGDIVTISLTKCDSKGLCILVNRK